MGGFFGVVSKTDCIREVFFGTDYHSHLGTIRGGMATVGGDEFFRSIHDITNAQFRSKFQDELHRFQGTKGIGVISDTDSQPLVINSHLGIYAIVTVGCIQNRLALAQKIFKEKSVHLSENSAGDINPTELVATLINQGKTFEDGIRHAQELIQGSCSLLLLSESGIFAARDKLGRTPIVLGKKPDAWAVSMESCAFPNLDYETERYLGPGEIVLISKDGFEQKQAPLDRLQICSFLWVYYGYPASSYEGMNVEVVRNRCGTMLARRESIQLDMVAGIPDSGIGHALGYASESGAPYRRPFVKYTPTWPRSFMPQEQNTRDLVAKMKLIPIRELIKGKKILFCEDSIVRGTQLKDTIQRLFDAGAKEIHMRPACPPLVYNCKFLNFSRSKSELDLAARRAIKELEGNENNFLDAYANTDSSQHSAMIQQVQKQLNLTSLKYQKLNDLVTAIGLPKEKLCTYCWDGQE